MPLTNESLVNMGGMVTVGDRQLMVRKLTQSREIGLARELARLTKIGFGPGGYFAQAADALDWLRTTKRTAEWQAAMKEISSLQATGADPSGEAIYAFQQTAKGVAVELFWRTRETHPTVTIEELEAVINEVSALDIHFQIQEAVTDQGKAQIPPGSPAS